MILGHAARTDSTTVTGRIEFWYRDLISCLQATIATSLIHAGREPLEVLGAHWEFLFRPGDVRPEEFYFPCRYPGDIGKSLAPYHPLSTRWWQPADDDDPLCEIRSSVAANSPVIAAVDNYYLSFRPAFGDVHASHLVVVYGLDDANGLIYVSDAMPPAFKGSIAIDEFLRAWSSVNPRDSQDAFFSDSQIGRRCLAADIGDSFPVVDSAFLRATLKQDLELFEAGHDGGLWSGEAGLRRFLEAVITRAQRGDTRALMEVYPFGWAMQAQSSLHGEFLRMWGAARDVPPVAEAGRLMESVAHAWTGLRITAAHGLADPVAVVPGLIRHARLLRRSYETAADGLHEGQEAL